MKNTILLIVFILLIGSCSSNNSPTYRILLVENDKLLTISTKMLKKKYILTCDFGKAEDPKYTYFLYQKFSNVSDIVYLPKNESDKDSLDLPELFWHTMAQIIESSDTITTSTIFNDINKNQPNLLLKKTFNNINIYTPIYSPVFYQEILSIIGLIIYSEFKYDFSKYNFKKIPTKDIITFNKDGETNIEELENVLNDIYIKENLLFARASEDGFIFIGEK